MFGKEKSPNRRLKREMKEKEGERERMRKER